MLRNTKKISFSLCLTIKKNWRDSKKMYNSTTRPPGYCWFDHNTCKQWCLEGIYRLKEETTVRRKEWEKTHRRNTSTTAISSALLIAPRLCCAVKSHFEERQVDGLAREFEMNMMVIPEKSIRVPGANDLLTTWERHLQLL